MESESKTFSVQQLISLGVLEIGDGYRAKNVELGGRGLPFARVANINSGFDFSNVDRFPEENLDKVGNKVSRIGDVVFTSKGTVGRFAFVTSATEQFVYSPQLCFWRSLDPSVLHPRYLYFWMQGPEFLAQVDALKAQTDMAEYVSLRDQRKMNMTLPPMSVQLEVARLLGALEDRTFLLRDINRTLESIARVIFKSWFIDFDPVHAKASGREPEGMDSETAALFPSEFEDSELGPIPRGWRLGKYAELATLLRDSIRPSDFPDVLFEHYSLPAYDAGQVPLKEYGHQIKSNKTRLQSGVVLQSKLNPHIRRVWLPGYVSSHAICSTEFLVWQPKDNFLQPYVYCLLKERTFAEQVQMLATGTSNSHQRVRPGHVADLSVVIPPSNVLSAFSRIATPLFQRVIHNRDQRQSLELLRDTLLPRLISGKLRIPEAEEIVQEAVS